MVAPPCSPPLAIPADVCLTSCNKDELLCDGGDRVPGVLVSPDWRIAGLNLSDTIAHYDTLDGKTVVKPTNCVCIYAPRFGAVRSVARIVASEQIDSPNGMMLPVAAVRQDAVDIPGASLQRIQARGDTGVRPPEAFVARATVGPITSVLMPLGFTENFLPYENFLLMRRGIFDAEEKVKLEEAVDAAIVWTATQALQVTLEGQAAVALTKDQRVQVTYTVEDRRCPKLRVCKVASRQSALPGEIVEFTIRFDNIGTQPIGNIVLVDNLTTRLEYVAGSAQASVKASFSTEVNQGESLRLRWEFADPLEADAGGLVRFKCKVR